jgi:hypothetical protein
MLLLLPVSGMATEKLALHSAEYKVKISILSGKLTTRLAAGDAGYSATHKIVPTGMARMFVGGSIEETSGFEPGEDGLMPAIYRSSDTLSKDKTEAELAFDWSTGAVTGTVNGESVEHVLEDLAHDRVSVQYELMHDLLNGGLSDTYILFDIDSLKVLNVSNIGSREVKVPAGKYTAIGIQHRAEGSSRVTTLWCAEELGYLPVIIEQHRDGKLRLRATLRNYSAG